MTGVKPQNPIRRFCRRIVYETNGCWSLSSIHEDRYMKYGIRWKVAYINAHKYSYILFRGPIPASLEVCHTCDHKWCINPWHLFLGTHQQNQIDMARKDRQTTAVLTYRKARRLKTLTRITNLQRVELAEIFGVHPTTVTSIAKGRSWAHA